MKNRIISLFIYLLPGLIYAQNNADDKYEIMSLTDMLNLFKDSIKTYQAGYKWYNCRMVHWQIP